MVLYHKSGIPTLCYNVWKPQVFVAHSWIEHNHSLTSRAASCHGSASERKKNIFFFVEETKGFNCVEKLQSQIFQQSVDIGITKWTQQQRPANCTSKYIHVD